jgi:hypothetical protein
LILLILLNLFLFSCTVTPIQVKDNTPSFDGASQNSGFIGFDDRGYGIITPNARARYNGLIEVYGKKFTPPLTPDVGLTLTSSNTYLIDPQHDVYARSMNHWKKQGVKP